MIEVKNLSRVFNKGKANEVRACDDISLKLENTGFYVIFGKSGAGKSSFMNALGGLDDYSAGTIAFDGKEYKHMVPDKCRVANIGYIFQNYCLDANSNVYDNVAFGLRSIGIRDEEVIFNRTMTALANVGMSKYYRRSVTTLSGGQQQRVAIARAMAKGSKIILADEPTGNLDDENTTLVMNILKELSKTRMVIVVTHEVDIVETYADKIIEIHDGKVVSQADGLSKDYEHTDKNKIFLKDLEKNSTELGSITIEQYGGDAPISIKVVNVDGKTYLQADSANLKIIDNKSEIKLLDETKEEYKEKQKQNLGVTLKNLDPIEAKKNAKVFKFRDCSSKDKNQTKKSKRRNGFLKIALSLLTVVIICISASWGALFNRIQNLSSYRLGNQVNVVMDSNQGFKDFMKVIKENNVQYTSFNYATNPREDYGYVDGEQIKVCSQPYGQLMMTTFDSQVNSESLTTQMKAQFMCKAMYELDKELQRGNKAVTKKEAVVTTGFIKYCIDKAKEKNPHVKINPEEAVDTAIGNRVQISMYDYGSPNEGVECTIVGVVEDEESKMYLHPSVASAVRENALFGMKEDYNRYEPLKVIERGTKLLGTVFGVDEIGTPDTDENDKPGMGEPIKPDGSEGIKNPLAEDGALYCKPFAAQRLVNILPYLNMENINIKIFETEDQNKYSSDFYVTEKTVNDMGGALFTYLLVNMGGRTSISLNFATEEEMIRVNDLLKAKDEESSYAYEVLANSVEAKGSQVGFEKEELNIMNIVNIVLFAMVFVISFLVIFANFMDKTKEVGIYRAIGVSKKNIVFKYFAENLKSVVAFVLLVILVLGGLFTIFSYFPLDAENPMLNGSMMFLAWWQLIGIAVIMSAMIMLISIIPPMNYVRRSPIKILSEYDM